MRHKPYSIRPIGGRLLCTRYYRPERLSEHIIGNPAWLRDNNRQLWRLVRWDEKGAAILQAGGMEPAAGMLLVTAPYQGVREPAVDDREEHFWIWADQVLMVLEEEDGEAEDSLQARS